MGSVQPPPPPDDFYIAQKQHERDTRRLMKEVALYAVEVFVGQWTASEQPGSATTKNKLAQIEKEVKQGLLSPEQAILALLEALPTQVTTAPPSLERTPASRQTHLLLNAHLFARFLEMHPDLDPQYLDHAKELINKLAKSQISLSAGAHVFQKLIIEANQGLPTMAQYPEFPATLFER
jgi:hypothetical protein